MKPSKNPLVPKITESHRGRMYSLSKLKLPEGLKKLCVWCLGPLTGKQRRWCGEECINSATAWAYPQKEHGLSVLLIRQEYKCAECKFDYAPIVESLYQKPRIPYGMVQSKDNWKTQFSYWVAHHLKSYMHVHDMPHRLEVDHILAISKGGQALGLENHRALCYACHKVKTKQDLSGKRKKNDSANSDSDSDALRPKD